MWNEDTMTHENTVIVQTTLKDRIAHEVHPVAYTQIGEVFTADRRHPSYGIDAGRTPYEAETSWPCENTREGIAARKLANEVELRAWAQHEATNLERWNDLPSDLQRIVGDFWHFRIVMKRDEGPSAVPGSTSCAICLMLPHHNAQPEPRSAPICRQRTARLPAGLWGGERFSR